MIRKVKYFFLVLIFLACSKDESIKKPVFDLTGVIIEKGQGVSGVSIAVDNQSRATTNSNGEFVVEDLEPGTYIIKPQQTDRSFLPAEISVTIGNTNVGSNDFVRAATDQLIHGERIWEKFRQSVYSIKQNEAETIQLDLEQNALWYQNSQGGLIFVTLSGNFTITARANAVRKSNNAQAVACNVCLGGLMVRDPASATGENYVHLVTGFTPNGLGVEYKSTTNGSSQFSTVPDGSAVHDLRIQRAGDTFNLYHKLTTETNWTLTTSYNRPGFPNAAQVGINIYTAAGGAVADLSVIFIGIRID